VSNKESYRQICEQKGNLPLFMQPWWLDAVCKHWHVAIARKGDMTTGVWPYHIEKKLGVTLLRSPVLTPYLGPMVFFPNDIKESNVDSFEHDTVSDLMKQLPDAKVWHLAIQPGMKQVGIFKNNDLKPQVQQTFLLELVDDEATLLSNMKESARRNIRVAEGEITILNSTKYLKELFKFHKIMLEKKGKSPAGYNLKILQKILDACIANDACAMWVAKRGDVIQAIVWQIWDNNCSYYFMSGQNPETNSHNSVTLCLWHAMKEAKRRGHQYFDLMGSMDEGVERFFRNFGGDRALYVVLMKNKSLLWKVKMAVLK